MSITYADLRQIVEASGLWAGDQARTHAFRLSPDCLELTKDQAASLSELAAAIHDCLAGLSRIAAIAANPALATGHTWQRLARIIRTGLPRPYLYFLAADPGRVPSICKVDLLQDPTGHFWIAEIDGHNKHGLGYAALAARLRAAVDPAATTFPGIGRAVSQIMQRHHSTELVLCYAHRERFYRPEFGVLAQELATHGVALSVCDELTAPLTFAAKPAADRQTFIDYSYFSERPSLNDWFVGALTEGHITTLMPPKPFLGSKALLALVANATGNAELEAILKSQIASSSLDRLRAHLPTTILVDRTTVSPSNGVRYVLKDVLASGMKGVTFDDSGSFPAALAGAVRSPYRSVLQQVIPLKPNQWRSFTAYGQLQEGTWYARLTMHIAARAVAELTVTARPDRDVHGAPDCLHLGTVIR